MNKPASAEALDMLDKAETPAIAAELEEASIPKPPLQQYRDQAGGPMRKATREQVWDIHANILGVLYKPQIAPDISRLSGHPIGKVCLALQELEQQGKVRKTGEQKAGWDVNLHDLWDRVLDG